MPLVGQTKYERVKFERDEWEARASSLLSALERQRATPEPQPRQRRWPVVLAAMWLLLAGLSFGVVVPKAAPPTLEPDYAPCISMYRAQHPLEDMHQELVNALYACGIYGT